MEKNTLKKIKLKMEDNHPKKYVSPTAGKVKPSITKKVKVKAKNFLTDVWLALKEIYKDIK